MMEAWRSGGCSGAIELYGAAGLPLHRASCVSSLLWDGVEFVEHDVEADAAAHARACSR